MTRPEYTMPAGSVTHKPLPDCQVRGAHYCHSRRPQPADGESPGTGAGALSTPATEAARSIAQSDSPAQGMAPTDEELARLNEVPCPRCNHVHLSYNDEPCVSCGCEIVVGVYIGGGVVQI